MVTVRVVFFHKTQGMGYTFQENFEDTYGTHPHCYPGEDTPYVLWILKRPNGHHEMESTAIKIPWENIAFYWESEQE